MAEDNISLPTCVLKVDLSCCGDCPTKLKQKLQKINGVYYINIDIEKGLVFVSATVNPTLIQKKIGKKAELLGYEKDLIQVKHKLHQFLRNMHNDVGTNNNERIQRKSSHSCFDSDDEDDVCAKRKSTTAQMPNGAIGRPDAGSYPVPPSPHARPYRMRRPYGYPIPSFNYHHSYTRPPLPPPSQIPLSNVMAIYSGQTEAPVGNSIFHSFSDENVRACTVM